MRGVDRTGFLSLGAGAGATVAIALGPLVAGGPVAAAASGPLTELDLALARLAVGAEILAAEFYSQATSAAKFEGSEQGALERALFNEREHLAAMSQILTGAGQTPSTADDFTITFPDGSFASRGSIATLGAMLEATFVGAYLGAVDAFGPPDLKTTAARIAASESEHVGFLSRIAYGRPIGNSFPAPLDYAIVSDAIAPYFG